MNQTTHLIIIVSHPHHLAHSVYEIPNMAITMVSCDYTLWHRKMGHAHQCVIKNLTDNTKGGPGTVTMEPPQACEGCEKGKSR